MLCFKIGIRKWLKRNMRGSAIECLVQRVVLREMPLRSFQVLCKWESWCARVAIVRVYTYTMILSSALEGIAARGSCAPSPCPRCSPGTGGPPLMLGVARETHFSPPITNSLRESSSHVVRSRINLRI